MRARETGIAILLLCACQSGGQEGHAERSVRALEVEEPLPFDLPPGAVRAAPVPGMEWVVQTRLGDPEPANERVVDGAEDADLEEDVDEEREARGRNDECERGEVRDGLGSCPADVDGDGAHDEIDCDDLNASVGPLAREIRCDGADQNCDGHDLCDRDGDGVVDWDDSAPDDPKLGLFPERVSDE